MKQIAFAVEVVISDNDNNVILVRELSTGKVLKVCKDPQELVSFFFKVIDSATDKIASENDKA